MATYNFVTVWRFESPLEPVWNLVYHSKDWPRWWRGVESVEELESGGGADDHVGSLYRYTWKSKLPYRLKFDMRLTRVEPMSVIEGEAVGELKGRGRWQLSDAGGVTTVRYDWNVETTRRWMNLVAPLARPLFKWNHNVVMGWGAEGLSKRLGVPLVGAKEG